MRVKDPRGGKWLDSGIEGRALYAILSLDFNPVGHRDFQAGN